MQPKAFEQARDLSAVEMRQEMAQGFILHSSDIELAAQDGLEQRIVLCVKEVEGRIGAALLGNGLRKLVELISSITRILEGGKELQIPAIGGFQQFAQRGQTVNGLLHGRPFGFLGAIAMFYLAVVFEKGEIVDRGLDP